jgi:ADP-ribose pyrophosphatase YjhB (NUDIX family)
MKFCSQCAKPVSQSIPQGDNRLRYVCSACETIHYQNPKIIAGCLPVWQNKVLLCKRAIEPRHGLWTLPAGFMENGESTEQGAIRETHEEACARVTIDKLYTLCSIPRINQVYMLFMGHLNIDNYGPGEESLEVTLFEEHEIPWEQLAFPVVETTLQHFFQDRQANQFPLHTWDII